MNEEIIARTILLIGDDGHKYGEIGTDEGRAIAEEKGFDLVEVSPEAKPPVVKLMDYGKYKYEQQKKAAEARKKQKVIEIKEIKMRPTIDDHDYDVNMRSVRRFFDEGDKVKVTLRFRGREMAHQHLGMELLTRIQKDVEPIAKIEQYPKIGRPPDDDGVGPALKGQRCVLGRGHFIATPRHRLRVTIASGQDNGDVASLCINFPREQRSKCRAAAGFYHQLQTLKCKADGAHQFRISNVESV